MTTERADQIEAELRAAGGQPVQVVPGGQTLIVFIGEPHLATGHNRQDGLPPT